MPLYELLCLAKPTLSKPELAKLITKVGRLVMDRKGVITNVTSYGEQYTSYYLRQPFEKYDRVGRSRRWLPVCAPRVLAASAGAVEAAAASSAALLRRLLCQSYA